MATVDDWFQEGFRAGFCTDVACATHDSFPLYLDGELDMIDEDFDDVCLPVVRLLHPGEQAQPCKAKRFDEALDLLRRFVSTEDCSLDHHGYCQVHLSFADGECRQLTLKKFLGLA